jgi:hypothetical protein
MMSPRRRLPAVELPQHVHRVISRGREYFYFQEARGTKHAGPRLRLPGDPHSPEFWAAVRQAQGLIAAASADTLAAVLDLYLTSPKFLGLGEGTQDQYRRALRLARDAWGALQIGGLRPIHIRTAMDRLAATPGKANNFLSAMRAFSTWARSHDHVDASLT